MAAAKTWRPHPPMNGPFSLFPFACVTRAGNREERTSVFGLVRSGCKTSISFYRIVQFAETHRVFTQEFNVFLFFLKPQLAEYPFRAAGAHLVCGAARGPSSTLADHWVPARLSSRGSESVAASTLSSCQKHDAERTPPLRG